MTDSAESVSATSHDELEPTDKVVDEHDADNGVRVDVIRRENPHNGETKKLLKVYGTRCDSYVPLGGQGAVRRRRKVKIAQFPETNGYDILEGLAEAYGYKLEPK